jgi:hypothetical protein
MDHSQRVGACVGDKERKKNGKKKVIILSHPSMGK